MTVQIERLRDLPPDGFAELVAESERSGLRFVRRLVDDWAAGVNRFDRPGEALFAARAGGRWVGVCGLNADPYIDRAGVGRVRHLYVLAAQRRRGVGRSLVTAVIGAARGAFDRLRLRTEDEGAARFYEGLSFRRCAGEPDCTHALEWPDAAGAEPSSGRPGLLQWPAWPP